MAECDPTAELAAAVAEGARVATAVDFQAAQVDGEPALVILMSYGTSDAPPVVVALTPDVVDHLVRQLCSAVYGALMGKGMAL